MSKTSQFGTPSGVLHCSMSPQGCFYAHVVQGGGAATCDTTAMFLSYLQRTFLGEVRAPDEEDGGHHAQKN